MNIFNKAVVTFLPLVPKNIVHRFAKRYIAGEELSDAVGVTKRLNDKGIMTTIDILGEFVTDKYKANQAKRENIDILDAIDKYKLDSNLSLKLTHIGLKIGVDYCLTNLIDILDKAKSINSFVRIDMEDSSSTSNTIEVYKKAQEHYPRCGIAVQSYLRRTYEDVQNIIEDKNTMANFRLCKGIYNEPKEIAFKKKEEIQVNFLKILRLMFEKNVYVGIATHDEQLVNGAYKMIEEFNKKKNEYEFQMLLGVKDNLRDEIVSKGHRLRVYVPYGRDWYGYSLRRFKENPQIAGYVLKSLFRLS